MDPHEPPTLTELQLQQLAEGERLDDPQLEKLVRNSPALQQQVAEYRLLYDMLSAREERLPAQQFNFAESVGAAIRKEDDKRERWDTRILPMIIVVGFMVLGLFDELFRMGLRIDNMIDGLLLAIEYTFQPFGGLRGAWGVLLPGPLLGGLFFLDWAYRKGKLQRAQASMRTSTKGSMSGSMMQGMEELEKLEQQLDELEKKL